MHHCSSYVSNAPFMNRLAQDATASCGCRLPSLRIIPIQQHRSLVSQAQIECFVREIRSNLLTHTDQQLQNLATARRTQGVVGRPRHTFPAPCAASPLAPSSWPWPSSWLGCSTTRSDTDSATRKEGEVVERSSHISERWHDCRIFTVIALLSESSLY